MKYYGIDVKRIQNNHRFCYEEPLPLPQPPSNIRQQSMREILEYTDRIPANK